VIDEVLLKGLVDKHYRLTGSRQALRLLNDWERYRRRFVKVMPHEYRRVLSERAAKKQLEAA
jgi:glutamate synthase (NADPH/NADH) large chain